MSAIGLDAAQLALVFPFHFGFGPDLRIVQVGSAWTRAGAGVRPGMSIPECFRLVRPALPLSAETLLHTQGSLIVLESVATGLPLKGQILRATEGGALVFIGSPLIRDAAEVKRFGLSLETWPAHDTVVDVLFLLRTKDQALTEARALSERLTRQDAELRSIAEALGSAVRQRDEAEAVVSAREASLRAILDTAADGIVTIDERGAIQSFNAGASRIFGWAPSEVIGGNVRILMPAPMCDEHDAYVARYLETGTKTVIGIGRETEGVRKDGSRFPLYLSISEFQGSSGRMFTGILRDLTALKQAQRAVETTEARTRLIVDTALDAVITIDQAGSVTLWNAQAEATFGWTREEALGRNLADLVIPARMRAAHATGMKRYVETGEARVVNRRIEIQALHRDGHEFPVELAISPLRDRDTLVFSAFVRDISVRKRNEQLLRLQYRVTHILDAESTLVGAAPQVLRAGGEYLGWSIGALWILDSQLGGLRCVDVWHEPDLDASAFVQQTRTSVFPPGVGLPGRVLADAAPVWLRMVGEEPNFPRGAAATQAGLCSAIGLPFTVDGRVGGVIEFLSRRIARPDEDETNTLSSLGTQIGQFLERRQAAEALRQSEGRLASVIDNMLEGLVLVDDGLRIVRTNPAFARIFGWEPDQLPGTPVTQLMPDRPDVPSNLATMYRQSLGRVTEQEGRRKNGELFPLQLQLYEVAAPEGRVIAAHVRDLTHEREADRLKKRFVASVSHELRTPLTAIRGSLGLLKLGTLGTLPPSASDAVNIAERNAVRLVGIINDLLDFERIQAGLLSLSRAQIPLDRAIGRSIESVQALAKQSSIDLQAEPCSIEVWADEDRVIQVLVNLLGNAIKFSPKGEQVGVRAVTRHDQALVEVHDHGRGVPEALREIIFQPFRQVEESDARQHGGSGIGLAICRAIVTQHGGEIGVDSEARHGSVFWFTLPLRPPLDAEQPLEP